MTALLYISYNSRLSEADKLDIDKLVFQSHLAVRKFVKKVYGKRKIVVVSTTLVVVIFFSETENAVEMGLTPMP